MKFDLDLYTLLTLLLCIKYKTVNETVKNLKSYSIIILYTSPSLYGYLVLITC